MITATGFLSIMIPIHLSMVLLALLAAALSKTPFRERLGLIRGTAPWWQYPVLILGTLGTGALAGWMFLSHISPGEDQLVLAKAFTRTTGIDGIVHTFYGIVPGFAEELIFRGFVLVGLLKRWKPVYAIAVVSVLFSLIHPDPYFMLAALLPGVWFGIMVWRAQSIWPAVICHGGFYIILALINRWFDAPATGFFSEFTPLTIGVGIFGLVMLAISVWLLFKKDGDEDSQFTT